MKNLTLDEFKKIHEDWKSTSVTTVAIPDLKKANSTIGVKSSQTLCCRRKKVLYPYR